MNNRDFFEFEDKDRDFPFYKNESFLSKNNLILLLLPIFLFVFLTFGSVKFYDGQEQIILLLVTLIPLLLLTKGKLSTFFRKPSLNDIRLIIICYICYEIYYVALVSFFNVISFQTTQTTNINLDFIILITNFLQIIGEEIFRAFVFLLFMCLLYKFTNNRKKSMIVSTVIMLVIFGLLHYNTYPNIIQILLLQGLGSISELFGYLKTKNLVVSIIIHLLINISGLIALMIR